MLTDVEFRVWTQYLLSADDFGVMHGVSVQVQSDNLHLANRPAKMITRCLAALVKYGLLHTFQHQGQPYLYQTDWQTWQKVEYPRATDNPQPTDEALARCDDNTRALFTKHPGGQRKDRRRGEDDPNHSARASRMYAESEQTLARAQPRETANGLRLTANGCSLEGGAGETVRMDLWFEQLKSVYPPNRITSGHRTMTAFVDVLSRAGDDLAEPTFGRMLSNLAKQKQGHEWKVKGMVPALEKWLRDGLWEQEHAEQAQAVEGPGSRLPAWAQRAKGQV